MRMHPKLDYKDIEARMGIRYRTSTERSKISMKRARTVRVPNNCLAWDQKSSNAAPPKTQQAVFANTAHPLTQENLDYNTTWPVDLVRGISHPSGRWLPLNTFLDPGEQVHTPSRDLLPLLHFFNRHITGSTVPTKEECEGAKAKYPAKERKQQAVREQSAREQTQQAAADNGQTKGHPVQIQTAPSFIPVGYLTSSAFIPASSVDAPSEVPVLPTQRRKRDRSEFSEKTTPTLPKEPKKRQKRSRKATPRTSAPANQTGEIVVEQNATANKRNRAQTPDHAEGALDAAIARYQARSNRSKRQKINRTMQTPTTGPPVAEPGFHTPGGFPNGFPGSLPHSPAPGMPIDSMTYPPNLDESTWSKDPAQIAVCDELVHGFLPAWRQGLAYDPEPEVPAFLDESDYPSPPSVNNAPVTDQGHPYFMAAQSHATHTPVQATEPFAPTEETIQETGASVEALPDFENTTTTSQIDPTLGNDNGFSFDAPTEAEASEPTGDFDEQWLAREQAEQEELSRLANEDWPYLIL